MPNCTSKSGSPYRSHHGLAQRWLRPTSCCLLIFAALAAAYSNSFQGEFVFDDGPSIEQNSSIRSLWPLTAVLWPGVDRGRTIDGRPLVNLSLAVNYAISGLNVRSYHVFNLLVHMGAAHLLFGFARRTFLLPRFRGHCGEYANPLAVSIALIWGLHPLQTESVTFVVQRAESMVALFYLATLYCVVRAETSARSRVWRSMAVLSCLAGMATKEVMVTAPVVVVTYLSLMVFGSLREAWIKRWPLICSLAATWALLAWLVIAHGGRGGSVDMDSALSPARYAQLQLVGVAHYLKLSISPWPLVFDYGRHLSPSLVQVTVSGIVLLLMAGATLWALARRSWIGFLGSSFFLILAPSSSVVPIVTQVWAEHRMYLPLASVVSLLVVLFWLLWRRCVGPGPWLNDRPIVRHVPTVLVLLVCMALGLQTWIRNLDYRTALALWTDVAQKAPGNPRAHLQLATVYLNHGNVNQAMVQLDQAIQLRPTDPGPYLVRGALRLRIGQFRLAELDFDRYLQLNPGYAQAYQNRGLARLKQHRFEQATADLTRAIELGPQLSRSYRYRASAYWALGQPIHARLDAQEYLRRGGTLDAELQEILKEPAATNQAPGGDVDSGPSQPERK